MAFKKTPQALAERPVIACAHDGCADPAMLSHGSANLCRKHYEIHISQEARDFCSMQGLITRSQKQAYCFAKMPSIREKFGRVKLPPPRVPGQDDEERVA